MNFEDTENFEESPQNSPIQSSFYVDDQNTQTTDLKANPESFSQNSMDIDLKKTNDPKRTLANDIDQELYNEVLEKLDIIQKNKKRDIQEKSITEKFPKSDNPQVKNKIEKILSQDFDKIQKLVKTGLINSEQGQNLKKEVLKKAFDKLVQTEKIKRKLPSVLKKDRPTQNPVNPNQTFEEFSQNNPNFFSSGGRQEVLNYLQSGGASLGKNELNKISELVRIVEKSAIDRYLQKVAHEKTLKNSNNNAKQKLIANAQKTGFSGNLSRTFTREQIGKMSSAEFNKYEPLIMEQLKKGQIK